MPMPPKNDHGQPIGESLADWSEPRFPPAARLEGQTVTLQPLDPQRHGRPLFAAFEDAPDSLWTYMSFGPFRDLRQFRRTLDSLTLNPGWITFTVFAGDRALGFASYLRIQPSDGSLEIGSIAWSPALQQTTAGTEALYLMIRQSFELGYRRCEWKCDSLNETSRRAAERLGFKYEGTFRQATVYKGRNRDTAWYAITDREWPVLDSTFRDWLEPDNFNADGTQRRRLRQLREGRRST